MTAKYIFYIVIVVVVLTLIGLSWYFYAKHNDMQIETRNMIFHTTTPVITRIIESNLPAKIDTIYIGSIPHEKASLDTIIVNGKTTVDLSISYDEASNLFSLDTSITSMIDSIYVEKEVIKTITKKPKFIGLTAGIGASMAKNSDGSMDISSGQIDAGLKIAGKYSITAFVNTEKEIGARFGIDF